MSGPYEHRLRAERVARRAVEVDLAPDAEARAAIAADLGLLRLPAVRLTGRLVPAPADAIAFEGRLTAEVVQPCGITLRPVATRIDEALRRVWSPHAGEDAFEDGSELEMGDDEVEPLGADIDLGAVLTEALALALPPFPRAEGASLEVAEVPEDEGRKPFAGLADLLKPKG